MAYWAGTLLASPIVRGSSGDTYGTHHSILGVGGYMEVNTIAERNAIPIDNVNSIGHDGMSSGQRRMGMLVFVYEDNTIYKLHVELSTWSGLTSTGKVSTLGNNLNWDIFIAGDSTSSGERLVKTFSQITHGFLVGDVIGHNGTEYSKVSNIEALTIEPLGVVSEVIDNTNFKLTISGYLSTVDMTDVDSNILSGGTVYYLSNTEGKITDIKPTGSTEVNKPVLVTMSTDTAIVLQYRGLLDNFETIDYDEYTGYTATTQQTLDTIVTGATNLAFFTGNTGVQTLPITFLSNSLNNGDYNSIPTCYYRDVNGVVVIGTATDGVHKRAYVRDNGVDPVKSWIWNEYIGDSNPLGWLLIHADVSSPEVYGTVVTGGSLVSYYIPTYVNPSWVTGTQYNNSGGVIISSVRGDLTSGDTYLNNGPIYKDKTDKSLNFRLIKSATPEKIDVKYDDYYINISGASLVNEIKNHGDGVAVFSGYSGTSAVLRTIVGDGNTSVTTDIDGRIVISSEGGGVSTDSSGERITRRITLEDHGFSVGDVIGWSEGAYGKPIASTNYDGEILGITSHVVNENTFELTQSGFVTGLSGLTTNLTYFVSDADLGEITSTAPISNGSIVKPILLANSSTTAWVLQYEGAVVTVPVTGDTKPADLYTGATTSNITVGGIPKGTTLTGRTFTSIVEEMLVETLIPVSSAPSQTFVNDIGSLYEYGCVLNINLESTFNKGEISLDGTFQNYRSGDVNCYYYSGSGLPLSVTSSQLSDNQSLSNFTVSATTVWGMCIGYCGGAQPLDSNGNPSGSPLVGGTTVADSLTVSGLHPYYWGTYASGDSPAGVNRPAATNDLVTGGTKVLSSSDGEINLDYNSTSDDYLWFAIPSTSTTKTCWDIDVFNNGKIGGGVSVGCNLFPAFDTVSVCSAQNCWNNVSYKVYVSNYQTSTSETMDLRNI